MSLSDLLQKPSNVSTALSSSRQEWDSNPRTQNLGSSETDLEHLSLASATELLQKYIQRKCQMLLNLFSLFLSLQAIDFHGEEDYWKVIQLNQTGHKFFLPHAYSTFYKFR